MRSLARKKRFKIELCFWVIDDVPEKEGMDLCMWKQMSSSKCSFTCICGIFLPLNPSTTTVYARSAFYPSLRFTLSLQSALYTQSAFYPWSAVRSLQSTVRSLRFTLTAKKGWEIFYFKSKKGAYFHIHIIKWLGVHHTSCDDGFY